MHYLDKIAMGIATTMKSVLIIINKFCDNIHVKDLTCKPPQFHQYSADICSQRIGKMERIWSLPHTLPSLGGKRKSW